MSKAPNAEVQITNQLIHTDTKGSLGDIENNTSSSMKEFVGHTLVNRGINFDINIVSSLSLKLENYRRVSINIFEFTL
jgi:hypothetical protein